ncbi:MULTISPECIES: enhanced intracellular survival protein Eis [unclassified Fusibacter]|uniref:GNAT family N-acetyltransferase n=1 Tax=unclassified Fusibacter TaxID=2624464 RepID=UPI001013298B|nr:MULTISPECIES: GNAT family N-acetyltransferase [unclassified Fusibacter]MCK8061212.1 GNAT family N-acetyltransferase [Fusibacter sp. A2]NPE23444.1 GNAT family N-acetyltransferase [Fusibacter sp. A1]RXV59223.1 GNAT family N-acetyltransferase [Fusibacter sp. A1]
MSYRIQPITKDNLKEYTRIQQRAYAGVFSGTPEEFEKLIKVYAGLLLGDDCFLFGVYHKDTMIGCYMTYDFTLNFHGNPVRASGIGSVAVDLIHKKEGVAKFLIKEWLSGSLEEGNLFCTLYPFNARFYKNFGFGYGSPLDVYQIPPTHFKDRGDKSLLSWGSLDSLEGIIECYQSYHVDTHGMKSRTFSDLDRITRQKHLKLIEVKQEGTVTGYMLFEQKGTNPDNFLNQKLIVSEMITTTPESRMALSSFLHSQADQIDYVELHTFDPYYYHMLDDLTFKSDPRVMQLISHKTANHAVGIMWHALDPRELMNLVSDRTDKGLDFFIKDERTGLIDAVSINTHVPERIELNMTRSTFSSWIIGSLPLNSAYQLGELKTNQHHTLKSLDKDFDFESPICHTRF